MIVTLLVDYKAIRSMKYATIVYKGIAMIATPAIYAKAAAVDAPRTAKYPPPHNTLMPKLLPWDAMLAHDSTTYEGTFARGKPSFLQRVKCKCRG